MRPWNYITEEADLGSSIDPTLYNPQGFYFTTSLKAINFRFTVSWQMLSEKVDKIPFFSLGVAIFWVSADVWPTVKSSGDLILTQDLKGLIWVFGILSWDIVYKKILLAEKILSCQLWFRVGNRTDFRKMNYWGDEDTFPLPPPWLSPTSPGSCVSLTQVIN